MVANIPSTTQAATTLPHASGASFTGDGERSSAELARARALLDRRAALLHSLDVPVAFVDADGRIENCNSAFALLCCSGDPVGAELGEALAMPPEAWKAASGGEWLQRIEPGGGRPALSVYRAGDGFALVGAR